MTIHFGRVIHILILIVLCSVISVNSCPPRCYCYRTNVRCMFLDLKTVPTVPEYATVLDLRFNSIKRLPKDSFQHLPNLNTLLLNNNEIEKLEKGSFNGLPGLRHLYLYKNKIKEVHPNAFASLPKLEQLFLHSNDLSSFPKGIFSNNPNLRRLRLDSNSLVCDCDMMWLADMLKNKHGQTQAAVTCRYPKKLEGRSLMSIPVDEFRCEKPRITEEPQNVEVTFGNTAYFNCRAEGNPVPDITWLHNDNVINTKMEDRYSILDDGTLMIESAQDQDEGVYECIARNTAGAVRTNKVELRYFGNDNIIPRFIERPRDITAAEGENVEIPCQATGNPRPNIEWTQNSATVRGNIRARQLENGALSITNIRIADGGLYECTATNSVQSISSSARLQILVRPVITRSPVDASVVQGSTANFTCEAEGDPTPSITWRKNGEALPLNDRYRVRRNGEILRIRHIKASDEGSYTCRAENTGGETTASARLRLISHEQPSFSEQNEVLTATVGTDVTLQCSAQGHPEPVYDWMREGRVLQNRNRMTISGGQLRIRNVQQHDAGRYDCVAENAAGRSTKSIFFQVHGVSVPRPGDRFVSNAISQATRQVNAAVNTTLAELFDNTKTHTVQDLLAAFRFPAPEALDVARAEEIYEQTLEIIYRHVREGNNYDLQDDTPIQELVSPAHLHLIANMSGCFQATLNIDCSNNCFNRRYRTMDGTCNNLQNPEWGAANTAFNRLLPPIYENGFNTPVGHSPHKVYHGTHLPSPRLISSLLMSNDRITDDDLYTHMLMQWGQFVDHDMDLAPQSVSYARFSDGRRCNETCENRNPCFPIPVPASDIRVQQQECLGFTRSSATCNTGTTSVFFKTVAQRQQINALTAFIDASNVYGSSDRMAGTVRHLASNRGLLREGPTSVSNRAMLPYDDDTLEHIDCQIEPNKRHVPCFRAGDPRANEQLALTAMHTLWMRHHNHIAGVISRINPHWDGHKTFHESRKIVGALMQHITYTSWLPKIIGPKGMAMMGAYSGYKPDVNPSIVNEFAVAALRFGHTLVQPVIFRLNESFQEIPEGNLPLHKAFFAPYRLLEEGGIDPLIRGLFAKSAKKRMPGEFFNSELTERLFELANAIGQDLAALNIQRGRDHGIQFYNDYREHCGLTRARSFQDLRGEIQHSETREKLQALYGHPDNIDLFIGGLSESLVEGAKVGPTFLCIIADQFQRLRDGDRFWYERESIFTPEQLVTIKQTSLSSVICESSEGITRVQNDVFVMVENNDDYISCDVIPRLDLRQWTDCCEDCRTRSTLTSFAAHFRGRRSVDQTLEEERRDEIKYNQRNNNSTKGEDILSIKEDIETERGDTSLLDERIEGLEEIIMEMSQTISDLKNKVQRIQKSNQRKRNSCKDKNHIRRGDGEEWKYDDCTWCVCKSGKISCRSENCTNV